MKTYVLGEPADVQALRQREQPQFPWPSNNNPMFSYLVKRALNDVEEDGVETTLVWLAVHAWFEGTLAGLSTRSDSEPSQDREMVFTLMRQLGVSEQTAKRHYAENLQRWMEERRKWIGGT
jgi:hypothetical protein